MQTACVPERERRGARRANAEERRDALARSASKEKSESKEQLFFFFFKNLSLELSLSTSAFASPLNSPRAMPPDDAHPSEADIAFMRLALVEVR